jgi:hypothetical protein
LEFVRANGFHDLQLRQTRFGLASCWRKVGEALREKQKRMKSLALPQGSEPLFQP